MAQPTERCVWIINFASARKKYNLNENSFFITYSLGIVSARDAWVYNFSKTKLKNNIRKTIDYYNKQMNLLLKNEIIEVQKKSSEGNWTRDWENQIKRRHSIIENIEEYRITLHRPFTRQNNYFDDDLNQERYQLPKIFPTEKHKNLIISITGVGSSKDFSILITDEIPDYQVMMNGQCFPLYYYEESDTQNANLFDANNKEKYIRRDAISDFILERCRTNYGISTSLNNHQKLSKEDIFYYVYGVLHSPQYRETFAADLKKMLPRLPLVDEPKDFWSFSKAGRDLADLHLNYETIEPYRGVRIIYGAGNDVNYRVEKMRFAKDGKESDKTKIIYNHQITLENIPLAAYEYVVNGKSAIEWIMERYAITPHKESGITNDPNDWATETGKPKYILDLLQSIINVSVQTVEIVKGLPELIF
ncbi:MAG: hypothetical protein FWE63_08875 [Bacteroidales bacterium]|nr:hypothetical protein [Bacteroidales bacterium]